jgi:hypothetical protein
MRGARLHHRPMSMYESHEPAHNQQEEQKQKESKQPGGRQHPRLVCWFLGGFTFGAIFQCLKTFSSIQQGTSNKTAETGPLFEMLFTSPLLDKLFFQLILVRYVLHLAKQVKYHQVLQLDGVLTSGLLLGYVVSLSMILSRQDRLLHQGFPILGMLTGDWTYCYGAFWTAQQYQNAAFWTAKQYQSLY